MSSEGKKQVSFGGEMGPVSTVVEKGKEAVAQGIHAVMCHIPGTPEHELYKEAEKLEASGLDVHVADDIAFERGPSIKSASTANATPARPLTADEIAFISEGPGHPAPDPMLAPVDVNHTADDIAFVKGGDEGSTPQPQRQSVDIHTADDLAFTKGQGGVAAPPPAAEVLKHSQGPADVLHTADDLAFSTKI